MSAVERPRDASTPSVDLLCVHRPRAARGENAGEAASEPQQLDFELVVSHARGRGLTTATVGYPDRGPSAPDLARGVGRFRPPVVYWHLPSRDAVQRMLAADGAAKTSSEAPTSGAVEIAGGDFAGRHATALLATAPRLDAVIRNEPEDALAAVAEAVRDGGDWRREAGLTLRGGGSDGAAAPRVNPPRPLLDDLDRLTPRMEDFFTAGRVDSGHRVMISRGCNSDCQYCGLQTPYRAEHPGRRAFWRPRSAASVLDEIERFHARGVRKFHFNSFVVFGYDAAGHEQVAAIAEGIAERGLDVELRFVTLARDLARNLDLLPALQRAGLAQVTLGIDSGLPRALGLYRVEQGEEETHACLAALARHGIPFYSSFIFYDPYLTLDEVRANLRFLDGLKPYYAHMGVPFSYFLDQQLLATTLRVRCDTPIYGQLVRDGLAERVDPLVRDPRIGMRHAAVGRLFQTHQAINKLFLPSLRPLLFHRDAVARHPRLESLPRDLLEHLVEVYEAAPETDPRSALADAAAWLRDVLEEDWPDMVATLSLDDDKREQLLAFCDTLARSAQAA